MTKRWSMAKVLLISVIGALVLSALFGIGAFLFGNFGRTSIRILATTLSVSFYSLMALACAAALEKRRAKVTALPGLVVCVIGFACLLLVIWEKYALVIWVECHPNEFAKASVILALFAFSFAQTCMLSFVRLKRQWVWVSWTAHVAIFWLAALLSTMVVSHQLLRDEWFVRIAGVLGIIDGCASLSIPLIYKLGGGIVSDVPRRRGSHIELECPACGLQGSYPIGSIQCPQCALKIRVEVAGMKTPTDDPPFQFSIKSLLLVMFIVATGLGLLTYRMEQVRAKRNFQIMLREGAVSVSHDGKSVMVSGAKPVRKQELMLLLEQSPDLEDAYFRAVPITDSGFAYFKKLNLKNIIFRGMQITEAGWAHIGEMTTLESLRITGTPISAEDIARLNNCNVHTLWLIGTGLTDAGLLHMACWPKLTYLYLSNEPKITKDGLAQLKDAPMLKTILLDANTGDLSNEDVDELRRTLRQIDIHAGRRRHRRFMPGPAIP